MNRSSTFSGGPPGANFCPIVSPLALHARSQSQPPESKPSFIALRAASPPTLAKRPRAPSDPFLDSAALSPSYASSTTHSSSVGQVVSASLSASESQEPDTPNTSVAGSNDVELKVAVVASQPVHISPQPPPNTDGYLRTWLSPDLSDPELFALLAVFPPFISRRTMPRFPAHRQKDAEGSAGDDESAIRVGTGRIWATERERSPGWAGSWWVRFKLWWKRLFCR
jgi:hypothetical protein